MRGYGVLVRSLLPLALTIATLAVAACGDDPDPEIPNATSVATEPAPLPDSPPPVDAPEPSPAPNRPRSGRVAVWMVPKGDWPLTVPEAVVRCEETNGRPAVSLQTTDGRRYGVNAAAVAQGLPRIDPIWLRDDDMPGGRVDLAPVLDRGVALCG
jgi:hypothetical protein